VSAGPAPQPAHPQGVGGVAVVAHLLLDVGPHVDEAVGGGGGGGGGAPTFHQVVTHAAWQPVTRDPVHAALL